jgi:hypothetical protein
VRRFAAAARTGTHRRASNRFGDTSSRPPVAVSDRVEVYPSPSVVAGQAELFKDPATSACLEGVLRIELGRELPAGTASRDQLLSRMTQIEQAVAPKVIDRMRAAGA